MTDVIPVALIMEDGMFRDVLSFRLAAETEFDAMAFTGSDVELPDVAAFAPRVALVDFRLKGEGERAGPNRDVESLCDAIPDLKVLSLLPSCSMHLIAEALRNGVCGCYSISEPVDQILDGIRKAATGEFAFSDAIRSRLTFDLEALRYKISDESGPPLTAKQLAVLRHLVQGLKTAEIARLMELSARSVETQERRLSERLGIKGRVQLTRWAIREGLVAL